MKKYKEYLYLLLSIFFFTLISFGYYFFIWISFVPLLLFLHNKNLKEGLIGIFLFSLLNSIIFFSWIGKYNYPLYLLVISLFILFYMLFYLISYIFKNKINFIFIYPVIYLFLLIIYSLFNFDFLLNLGIYQILNPLTYYIKGFGISFLIILFNCLITVYIIENKKYYLYILIIFIIIILGCFYYTNTQKEDIKFNINLVQGNYSSAWKWREKNLDLIFNSYIEMSENAKENGIIIWPEYALVGNLTKEHYYKISNLAKEKNSYIIFGNNLYLQELKYYDAAFVINNTGNIQGVYLSVLPYLFDKVNKGIEQYLFNSPFGKFGIVICFEEMSYYISNKYKKNNAEFLIFMSNNMDLDGTRGINLALQVSRLRAAENKILVIRSTNTGISAIIDSNGKIISKLNNYDKNILSLENEL